MTGRGQLGVVSELLLCGRDRKALASGMLWQRPVMLWLLFGVKSCREKGKGGIRFREV